MSDQAALDTVATLPAKRAIRLIGLRLLDQADQTFTRLSQSADHEALHDFRVALRRLRTHARSYRSWLRESVNRKQERRLRRIARASNPTRDLQVLIEQLDAIADPNELERTGIALLKPQLEIGLAGAVAEFRDESLHEFPDLSRELRVGLSSYRAELRVDGAEEETLGRVAARLIARLRDELQDELASVLSIEHQEAAHRARLAGKRVRYLLEPFRNAIPRCAEAVEALKQFQDAVGEMHDLHVLMTSIDESVADAVAGNQPSLSAVRAHVAELRRKAFKQVGQDYLDSNGGIAIDLTRLAEQALRQTRSPLEIERKFLLKRMPRIKHAAQSKIHQGYLPGSAIRERVRSIENEEGRKFFRTFKAGQGTVRIEIEEETTEKIFKRLFALTRGHRVRKRRYRLEENGACWEIDRFLDRKLVLAEIELESPDDPVDFPPWLRSLIIREVTGDPDYTNERLAR